MEKYEFLTEHQNEILKKYFKEGVKNFSRSDFETMKKIREKCLKILLSEEKAKELLFAIS